jgi:uncharacterized protein (TIGR02466 family)
MPLQILFPSFVYHEKLSIDLSSLKDSISELKLYDVGVNKSNEGGWHSGDISDKFDNLFLLVKAECNNILHEFNITGSCNIKSAWINANNYKDFNKIHTHPGSFLSGVFYIKTPDNSGNIYFENPNPIVEHSLYGIKIRERNLLNSISYEIKPQENDLLIFPSYLPHYVKPNLSNEERISLAFNVEVV